jgi:hypothetical protein
MSAYGTYLVQGQEDISLEVGDTGDKTLTIDLDASTTQVFLKNMDPKQGVMYAVAYPAPAPPNPQRPVFPADWSKLHPEKEVKFPVGSVLKIHLRKLKFIRGDYATNDVPVKVQVGESALT